jgi:FAD/FMN-containing dehydrogenase
MPYPVMNTLLDGGFPQGALNYWLSSFTRGITDGLIDTMVEQFASVPSAMSAIMLEHFHGAVTRVGVTATAVPHRAEGWNLLIPSVWTDPAATEENIAWTRETHRALAPQLDERRWLNYLGDDQGADAVRGAYGPNYERLLALKRRYDPENVFHHNQNIDPA